MGVPQKYLKMGGGGLNKMTLGILRLYHKMVVVGVGGGVIIKWGEGAMIFIFLLLPEMVNTLILLLELMCFL